VSRRSIERKLRQVGSRLRSLRDELRIADEQFAQLRDEADDMTIRAMVAETSHAGIEARHAQGHADAMAKHRAHLVDSIAELERTQDRLLDELGAL
jgi:chromosome segregation ATPase